MVCRKCDGKKKRRKKETSVIVLLEVSSGCFLFMYSGLSFPSFRLTNELSESRIRRFFSRYLYDLPVAQGV